MTNHLKIGALAAFIVVALGLGVWWNIAHPISGAALSQNSANNADLSTAASSTGVAPNQPNSTTGASTQTPYSSNTGTVSNFGVITSGPSNYSLQQDAANIDMQMSGLRSDSASADSGMATQ
jgi:cytoskeletal protein RodZ